MKNLQASLEEIEGLPTTLLPADHPSRVVAARVRELNALIIKAREELDYATNRGVEGVDWEYVFRARDLLLTVPDQPVVTHDDICLCGSAATCWKKPEGSKP